MRSLVEPEPGALIGRRAATQPAALLVHDDGDARTCHERGGGQAHEAAADHVHGSSVGGVEMRRGGHTHTTTQPDGV